MTPRPPMDPPEPPLVSCEVFDLIRPIGRTGRMVFASPHSGGDRPDDMGAVAGLSEATLRSAEDVAVDRLIASGARHGIPVIAARLSRAYVDLNRDPSELDALLVDGVEAGAPSAKVSAGFGVIPRRAGDGATLYDRRLSSQEAQGRLDRAHAPYHAALERLVIDARAAHGGAVLIDWHSMPSRAAGNGGRSQRSVDVVLGDRHGSACRPATTRQARALFEAQGWRVGLNAPFAGGYGTMRFGRPGEGFEALQVELNRALYLDERTLTPSGDFEAVRATLETVIADLAATLAN